MAKMGENLLDREKLCCSICLDLLKVPATIPCGHSYCMSCIKRYWDEEDQKETLSCPQCRQTFTLRPALVRNTVIADLVEETKKTELQADKTDLSHAGPGDVTCDFCTEIKQKAVKSCLQCLVSYCEQHLQPHYDVPALKKHKLVDPSKKLQEIICSRHNEVMKIFCRTDQQCICYLCSMDEHKGHDTVSAAAEMSEKQKELKVSQQNIQQRIQDSENHAKALEQKVEAINQSADKAVRDSEKIFTEVKQQIRSRQKSEVTRVNELQKKLQREISELRRRNTELEQLSLTEDHTQFLYNYTLLSRLGEATDSSGISICPQRYTEDMTAAVSEARYKLWAVLDEKWTKTSVTEGDALLPQTEPRTRAEFLNYGSEISLDGSTAHNYISIDQLTARFYFLNQSYSSYFHPDRFTDWCQVLCRESLTGRCYWEVECEGTDMFVAVAYKEISRSGRESAFGNNDKSWALKCFHSGYEFIHKSVRTPVSGPWSSRIGVYLDHRAGILSFYGVKETTGTMSLLHRVQTRFSRPLCPGFGIYLGASVKIHDVSAVYIPRKPNAKKKQTETRW